MVPAAGESPRKAVPVDTRSERDLEAGMLLGKCVRNTDELWAFKKCCVGYLGKNVKITHLTSNILQLTLCLEVFEPLKSLH